MILQNEQLILTLVYKNNISRQKHECLQYIQQNDKEARELLQEVSSIFDIHANKVIDKISATPEEKNTKAHKANEMQKVTFELMKYFTKEIQKKYSEFQPRRIIESVKIGKCYFSKCRLQAILLESNTRDFVAEAALVDSLRSTIEKNQQALLGLVGKFKKVTEKDILKYLEDCKDIMRKWEVEMEKPVGDE